MAIGTAAAILGASAIGAGASILGGSAAAKAQKSAAAQQAANERYFYDQTRADQAPYREAGATALGKLSGMYGIGAGPGGAAIDYTGYVKSQPDLLAAYQAQVDKPGGFQNIADFGKMHYQKFGAGENRDVSGVSSGVADYGGFMASPGYQFRLDEGIKAAERSAAARGLLGSGGTVKAIQRYGEGLASSEYENYANALRSMAGIGQTSTQATSQAGQVAAQGISNAFQNAGNARASSYANTGAAVNQGISNVLGSYLQGGFGGGGGFSGATLSGAQQAQLASGVGGIGAGGSVAMPSWYGG